MREAEEEEEEVRADTLTHTVRPKIRLDHISMCVI